MTGPFIPTCDMCEVRGIVFHYFRTSDGRVICNMCSLINDNIEIGCSWCANVAPRKYMRVLDGSLLCIDCIKQVAEMCYTKS